MSHAHQPKAQVSAVPRVDPDLCRACRRCLAREVCRSKALLRIDREEPPFVDAGRCYGCRACVPACPHGAIRVNGSA